MNFYIILNYILGQLLLLLLPPMTIVTATEDFYVSISYDTSYSNKNYNLSIYPPPFHTLLLQKQLRVFIWHLFWHSLYLWWQNDSSCWKSTKFLSLTETSGLQWASEGFVFTKMIELSDHQLVLHLQDNVA